MKIKALEICGPGFFWAWCYCLWFVPNLYGESAVTAPGESESWLFVLFSAAIVQFIVPLCLRKRHLSAFPFLYAIAPLLVFGGTLLIELSRISSINGLYLSGSIVSGASSAFLWHLWGDYYASTRNDNGVGIAFGFGLTLLASIAITSFTPPVVSCIFVAVTPLLSGGMLIALKRMRNHADYPPHPPAACRKTSRLAILKICTIAFIACSIGTYSWASIDTSLLPIGHNAIPLGVATGAFFMIVAALPKYLLHEKMQTGKIFSWMLFLCILGIALSLIGSKEIATASYIVSMAATVAFDVLLATYFISLVVKGYVTSTTAFGYSEGCICAAMLVGNIAHNSISLGWHEGDTMQVTGLVCICLLCVLQILLNDQQSYIRTITTEPIHESELEKNCVEIAREYKLSQREYDVMLLIGKGHTPKSAANVLYISPSTAQTHIKHIYQKLRVHSRTELIEFVNLPMGGSKTSLK